MPHRLTQAEIRTRLAPALADKTHWIVMGPTRGPGFTAVCNLLAALFTHAAASMPEAAALLTAVAKMAPKKDPLRN